MTIQEGISDADYHADRKSLSSSGARLLLESPAKFRWQMDNPPPSTPTFDFGRLAHVMVLGEGSEVAVVDARDWRSKAAREARDEAYIAGKIPALASEVQTAEAMREAVFANSVARTLLFRGKAEVSWYADDPETGIRLRARPDWLPDGDGRPMIVDYKTAASADPKVFGRKVFDFGYHIQAAWYVTVAELLGMENAAFLFIVQEKAAPYLTSVCELDAEAFAAGKARMREAIRIYRDCTESGVWPGYGDLIHTLELPPWHRVNLADV